MSMARAREEYEWWETKMIQIRFKMDTIILRLQEFMENEARSCSIDFGCVTPEYVYRMWGGSVTLNDIKVAMREVKLPM